MSTFLIAFITSISASAWVYNKFMRTTGSNTQKSIGGAAAIGLMVFILFYGTLTFVV